MYQNKGNTALENHIYLASPTMHGDELKYMQEAYRTNWMSTVGENLDTIEREIAKKTGCAYAVALSSGTAALHLAVRLAGVKKGDKVFCSSATFIATVNPVVYEGAIPILIDSEYDTWNMDPKALEKAFEKHPDVKHVMIVNLFGTPGKLDEIRAICDAHSAVLIEDAAESFGASYKGRPAGSFGDISVISFNGNKVITGSSGGALLVNSEEEAELARKLSTQCRDDAPWYQHSQYGYNYRMSNVIAGVIRGQLPYLEEHIEKKKEIYLRYKKGLSGLPVKMNPYDESCSEPNFWLSCITVDPEAMASQKRSDCTYKYDKEQGKSCPCEIIETLAINNIEARPIWKPMNLQPVYSFAEFIGNGVGEDIFDRGVCLPSDIKMTADKQDRVMDIIAQCFE